MTDSSDFSVYIVMQKKHKVQESPQAKNGGALQYNAMTKFQTKMQVKECF